MESNLPIERVGRILALTDKLISPKREKGLELFDSVKYQEQKEIELMILNFIFAHFWHFLSDIKKHQLRGFTEPRTFEYGLFEKIIAEKQKAIEFPYAEHRMRNGRGYGYGIDGWSKMKDVEKEKHHKRGSLLDDEFRYAVLRNLNARIIGKVFYKISDTSVGKVTGIGVRVVSNKLG